MIWPEGFTADSAKQRIWNYFYPESESSTSSSHIHTPITSVTAPCPRVEISSDMRSVLTDLAELEYAGEPVVWPSGFSSTSARAALISSDAEVPSDTA